MDNSSLYWRWKNGTELKVLAKEAGVTKERMRHRLKKIESDAGLQTMIALKSMVSMIDDFMETYDGIYVESSRGVMTNTWEDMELGGPLDAWLQEYRDAKKVIRKFDQDAQD